MANLFKKDKFYIAYLIGIFLILLLPLLSIPPLFHPASWAKGIALRVIFSIIIFIVVLEIFSKKGLFQEAKLKLQKRGVRICFGLLATYLGIFALANIFSLNPYFSFLGNPYRGGGFLTLAYCILFAMFLFFVLKDRHWRKVIDLTILVATLVALIAVFQKFSLFSEYLVSYSWRPVSTMGGPIFLALYLTLIMFLPLALGLDNKGKKRIFYFISFILIFLGIFLTATRAAFLAIAVALLFFIFLYPKKSKLILFSKIAIIALIIVSILGISWLKGQPPETVEKLRENKIIGASFGRMWTGLGEESIFQLITRSRLGGWTILWRSLKERPILGYGPENLAIAFDRNFDSSLPGISSIGIGGEVGSWWDRGHSIVFDIAIQAGIPALVIYFSLFGCLFWQLQKKKKEKPEKVLIYHGLQTAFLAYLTTNLFSFDLTSTYLISFLLIGYALFLIKENGKQEENLRIIEHKKPTLIKYIISTILLFGLVWFIWQYNVVPLQLNKILNQNAYGLIEAQKNYHKDNPDLAKSQYVKILERLEGFSSKHSFIDSYFILKYIDAINIGNNVILPENTLKLSQKAVQLLVEYKKMDSFYTRGWIFMGVYLNKVMAMDLNLSPEQKEDLNEEIYYNLEEAKKLSPKRPDPYYIWAKNRLYNQEWQEALDSSNKCLETVPDYGNCYLSKGLALLGLREYEEAIRYTQAIVDSRGGDKHKAVMLFQLITAYSKVAKDTGEVKYYQLLKDLYLEIMKYEPNDFQHHASLAYIYAFLEDYSNARKEAMIVLEISPESKESVEAFLKNLPL